MYFKFGNLTVRQFLECIEGEAAVERSLVGLSTTNCGWAIYAVRDALLDDVKREQYRRTVNAATEPVEVVS